MPVIIEFSRCIGTYSSAKFELKRSIPLETLETIAIFGKSQMTTQATEECLKRGIPVSYYSIGGKYFGRLQSTGHINAERQRRQDRLYDEDNFAVELSKCFIDAKINNQIVVLRRYARTNDEVIDEEIGKMRFLRKKVEGCQNVEELMGYEGNVARLYFSCLSRLVVPEFTFSGRSRRPPQDEFNAMLSLGYSIILNEIYGKIEMRGLNPYFGFMHKDKEKHPTLASDLMEEWRPVIVDSLVMSLVNGHEIYLEHFQRDLEEPGVYLTREGMKIFIGKLEKKMQTQAKYSEDIDYPVSFRRAMELQVGLLIKAIEAGDASIYHPIYIR